VLREEFVKQATGGDHLKGRWMRGDFFEFSPTHKLHLVTNHRPTIRGQDHGIWRRVMLIPYACIFGSAEEVKTGAAAALKDPTLPAAILRECRGILAWLVQGAVLWRTEGLNPPAVVLQASASYRAEQDRVRQFIAECCTLDQSAWTQLSGPFSLFAEYQQWAKGSGYHPLGRGKFQDAVLRIVPTGRWVERNNGDGGRSGFEGLKLNSEYVA
jgi:putative DNA primase/helicase